MENIFNTVLEIVLSVGLGALVLYVTTLRVESRTNFKSINLKAFKDNCVLDITKIGDRELVRDYRTGKETIYIV